MKKITISKVIITPHISPNFYFLLASSKKNFLKVYPIPFKADFNFQKFKNEIKRNL